MPERFLYLALERSVIGSKVGLDAQFVRVLVRAKPVGEVRAENPADLRQPGKYSS